MSTAMPAVHELSVGAHDIQSISGDYESCPVRGARVSSNTTLLQKSDDRMHHHLVDSLVLKIHRSKGKHVSSLD